MEAAGVEPDLLILKAAVQELGTPHELIGHFGDQTKYHQALRALEQELYRVDSGCVGVSPGRPRAMMKHGP